jgi:adenylate cyclase class IV
MMWCFAVLFIFILVLVVVFRGPAVMMLCKLLGLSCAVGAVGAHEPSRTSPWTGSGQEYEMKFLDVNVCDLRKKLAGIGAQKVYDTRMFRRCAYNLPRVGQRGYARVRDEGDKVVLTVKTYNDQSKYPDEYEVQISENFDEGKKFMESLGLVQKAYQETLREKWEYAGCNEIAIDTIPGLATYVEIDCTSEEKVKETARALGFDPAQAHYGAFALTYEEVYGIPQKVVNEQTPVLTFESARESLGPHVTKNKDIFDSVLEQQLKKKY